MPLGIFGLHRLRTDKKLQQIFENNDYFKWRQNYLKISNIVKSIGYDYMTGN